MKTILCFFSLGLGCILSFASDLALTDGRVLKDATIVAQSPRTVTVKHAAGLSSVAKTILPPELQARYPVDEAAAREADLKAELDRAKAKELAIERQAREKAQREEAVATKPEPVLDPAAKEKAKYNGAMKEVKERAQDYFTTVFEPVAKAKNVKKVTVTIQELQLVAGWNKRWFVKGKCDVKFYERVMVSPYYSPEMLRVYWETQTEPDYTERGSEIYSYQTQEFEAFYSTETATPSFDVTLR